MDKCGSKIENSFRKKKIQYFSFKNMYLFFNTEYPDLKRKCKQIQLYKLPAKCI